MLSRELFGAVAIIPFVFGLNLQTGQNFFSIGGLNDTGAALLGLVCELLAFGLTAASRHKASRLLIAVVFLIQAPLVAAWGILVGMFSGFGDGASRGAGLSDILPWFLRACLKNNSSGDSGEHEFDHR
ncbi:MAG: hypothetical protein V4584_10560, partial [Verrucomicrobiota bacterium]